MADTYEKFTTTGQTVFTLPFSSNYLLKSHVKVYKGRDLLLETQTATLSEGTDYTFSSATQITLSTGLASGEELTIQRQTPEASQLSPWNDGSNLTAEALNKADLQCLYVVQEQSELNALNAAKAEASKTTANTASTNASNAVTAANAALPKAGGSMTGPIAMGTNKITGLGDPTAAQDAVTKAYLERTGSIQSAQIQDGTLVNDDVNASAAIAQSKLDIANATTSASGYMSAADKTKLDSCDTGAKDDQTAAEIKTLVDAATDSNVYTDAEKTKLAGCDTGAKDDQTASEIRALVESATDSNVFTDADHTKLNGIETAATADQTAAEIKTAYESNAQTNPLTDAEKSVIDGVTANTSELNKLDGVTASTTELNIVAGKSFRASTDGALSTTSDTEMPSSKVIANHVAAQIVTVGGFTTIANDASFPATASQPATGVIISISDAQGVAVSGTTSTTGRTVDSTPATVTINNFPSSLTGETLASGVGLLVTSTGSGNIYNYHKLLAAESDVKQLSDDINDFNARYRIASSAPGSNNDDGDLWFDTSAKKMKVYNGTTTAWDDVASVGNFFINTLSSSSGTGGGNANFATGVYRFTLSNPPTMAQQLIVSVNGVIQKPNSGTSQPSEGFAIDGSDIIFSAAPASGSDFFIITQGSSVSIGTPSDNTVTAGKIVDGEIGNTKISNSANIAGSKVADDSIPEVKLDIHNAPATDKFLKYTSNGMEWSDGASEGTDVKSTGESGTAKFLRVDGDGTCSWQVPPDNNTVYTHPNHSGEVTSTADGAQTIASNVVDEDNLKVSNSPTNGQFLQAQSGNTGGLTWADVSAAPEVELTASGSISNHQSVCVKSNGQVEAVTSTLSVASPPTSTHAGSAGIMAQNINLSRGSAYCSSTDRVVMCLGPNDSTSGIKVYVGQISNNSISWGSLSSSLGGSSSSSFRETGIACNGNGKVIVFGHLWSNSGQVKAWCGDINASAKTVSFGSDLNTGYAGTSGQYMCNPVWTSNTSVFHLKRDGQQSDNFRYTTYSINSSTNAITQDTGYTNLGTGNGSPAVDYRNGKVFIAVKNNSNTLSVRFATVSGSSVSWGSWVTVSTGIAEVDVVWVSDTTAVAVFGNNDDTKGSSIAFTIGSGSSDVTVTSQGSVEHFQGSYNARYPKVYWDDYIDRLVLSYHDNTNSTNGWITQLGSISGNSATWDSNTVTNNVASSDMKDNVDNLNDTTNNRQIVIGTWQHTGDSSYGTSTFVVETSDLSTNGQSFIGYSKGAYTNGQTATIAVTGNTTTQSSLTPGSRYYLQKNGSLATTSDQTPNVDAGIALSSTKLLIKG